MPVRVPVSLPAVEALREENIFVIDEQRASSQDIRPLRISILNLMPLKIMTETDLLRLISNTPLQVELDFIDTDSHVWYIPAYCPWGKNKGLLFFQKSLLRKYPFLLYLSI